MLHVTWAPLVKRRYVKSPAQFHEIWLVRLIDRLPDRVMAAKSLDIAFFGDQCRGRPFDTLGSAGCGRSCNAGVDRRPSGVLAMKIS